LYLAVRAQAVSDVAGSPEKRIRRYALTLKKAGMGMERRMQEVRGAALGLRNVLFCNVRSTRMTYNCVHERRLSFIHLGAALAPSPETAQLR
jgi:hypothetical protein